MILSPGLTPIRPTSVTVILKFLSAQQNYDLAGCAQKCVRFEDVESPRRIKDSDSFIVNSLRWIKLKST